MANVAFDGQTINNIFWDVDGSAFKYVKIASSPGAAIYYQGYYYSSDPATTPHKWSSVYTTGYQGQIDCNLGDTDWLGPTAVTRTGDKVVLVFWEKKAGTDRTNQEVLFGRRGFVELSIGASGTHTIYPLIALTYIKRTYSDNLPESFGELDYSYEFNYSDDWDKTYDSGPLVFYNRATFKDQYVDNTIVVSHEDSIYGEQIFPIVTDIKETLIFEPDGDFTERSQSTTTTTFNHSFTNYNRSYLRLYLEYEVGGVYYSAPTWSSSLNRDYTTVETYFIDTIIKTPGEYDISVYRDRSFRLKITTSSVDYLEFKAVIKESFSSSTILATFDIDVDTVNNYLELSLPSTVTETLLEDPVFNASSVNSLKSLVWDLKVTTPVGNKYTMLFGNANIYRSVTRSI
jgi:hypothetical protein